MLPAQPLSGRLPLPGAQLGEGAFSLPSFHLLMCSQSLNIVVV